MSRSGYTLIELVVVLAIAGMLLMFILPRFQGVSLLSSPASASGQMVKTIRLLKEQALKRQTDLVLNLEPAANRYWVTSSAMSEEESRQAVEAATVLPDDALLLDVEMPVKPVSDSGVICLRFSRHGYSDMALIHIREDTTTTTLRLEPFLDRPVVEDRHSGFDCY